MSSSSESHDPEPKIVKGLSSLTESIEEMTSAMKILRNEIVDLTSAVSEVVDAIRGFREDLNEKMEQVQISTKSLNGELMTDMWHALKANTEALIAARQGYEARINASTIE